MNEGKKFFNLRFCATSEIIFMTIKLLPMP